MSISYTYRAINDEGVVLIGHIDAPDPAQARQMLLTRGLMVTHVSKKGQSLSLRRFFAPRVTHKNLILFSKQFRTLYNAGISMTKLLQILQHQTENRTLQIITADIALRINRGSSLHTAFSAHPAVFSSLYCAMIHAGETSGALSAILDRLIALLEHENTINCDIKAALRYPKLVVFTLLLAFIVLLNGVIPSFAQIFAQSHLTLAFPTRIAIAMNQLFMDWWALILLLPLVGMLCWRRFVRTKRGRYVQDRLLLALPVLGPVLQKSIMARFASIFAVLQRSGVSILQSFDILSATIGNAAIEREFTKVRELLRAGKGISQPLGSVRYFTPLVINMVAVGEHSGNLEEMLDELALHYDAEVAYAVGELTEAIGPLLVIALAIVIGFFALAIFLPMWDMVQLVH
ncbi:MAG: type II secretion system F family protein [Bilophila sp.]